MGDCGGERGAHSVEVQRCELITPQSHNQIDDVKVGNCKQKWEGNLRCNKKLEKDECKQQSNLMNFRSLHVENNTTATVGH